MNQSKITNIDLPVYSFSICTILNDPAEYEVMKNSFMSAGFDHDCEYLVIDNSVSNKMDAYAGINWFLQKAAGNYIIIVHQDVRCMDNRLQLETLLTDLDNKDPKWAVAGNAGCMGYKNCYHYLTYPGKRSLSTGLPKRVNSLDENLLIIHHDRKPALTATLRGFHLYGTDICLHAERDGHSCYVIPFMVEHLSLGNLRDLDTFLPGFLEQYDYTQQHKGQFVQTTCTKFYLGTSKEQSLRYNKKPLFELVKAWERIKMLFQPR